MAHIWRARDDRYSEVRGAATKALPVLDGKKIEMSYIGG
jgi:cyclic pyranopterin phosphate synthase